MIYCQLKLYTYCEYFGVFLVPVSFFVIYYRMGDLFEMHPRVETVECRLRIAWQRDPWQRSAGRTPHPSRAGPGRSGPTRICAGAIRAPERESKNEPPKNQFSKIASVTPLK